MALNDNEKRALKAICDDCDDLDGWGFTRVSSVANVLADVFDGNPQRAGGYIKCLADKGYVDVNVFDDEVWVNPDVFVQYA